MQEEKDKQNEVNQAQRSPAVEAPSKSAAQAGVAHTAKPKKRSGVQAKHHDDPYLRPENEDDDGYDPFSDRPPEREPLFQRDPWA